VLRRVPGPSRPIRMQISPARGPSGAGFTPETLRAGCGTIRYSRCVIPTSPAPWRGFSFADTPGLSGWGAVQSTGYEIFPTSPAPPSGAFSLIELARSDDLKPRANRGRMPPMSDLLARATHRLLKLRDRLVKEGPDLPKPSAALLKRSISLAEMHVRVLRGLKKPDSQG
jgi:hypothetical protein